MSAKRRKKRELKRVSKVEAGRLVKLIDKFIKAGIMTIDTENYHVSMLDSLWDIYTGKKQINFLDNIKLYCSIMNAYNEKPFDVENVILISIKNSVNESVEPKYYYKSGTITGYV